MGYFPTEKTKTYLDTFNGLAVTYDADGNRTSVTTPEGITTRFEHNLRGERTSLTGPAGNTMVYTYNPFGEQTALQNRRGHSYTFTFDADGNPLATTTPLGHAANMQYDDLGRLQKIERPSGDTTTYTYDAAGRPATATDALGTLATTYDPNGNPLTLTEGATTITRTYDKRNRVATATDASGSTIRYSYYKNSLLKTLAYPGGKTVTYKYDARNRLKTVTDWASRVTTYTWDAAGRLTGIARPNGTSRANQYTDDNELDRFFEYGPGQSTLHAHARFSYDDDSRIDWRYRLPRPQKVELPTFNATYDADNRLKTFNTKPVTHDKDGNMTSGPLADVANFAAYTYDARNRLTAAGGLNYTYDPANNRIGRTDTSGTTKYTIDAHGDALPRVLVRTKPDGSITRYVYGIGLLYEVDDSDAATYYHYDQSGSTIALTNSTGAVTDRVEYSPFGTITHREGTTDTPYLYVGQLGIQTDSNGLLHMRARYYNPLIRRFINADPIGFDGGLNWYAYAEGNPVMYVDPSGNLFEAANVGRQPTGVLDFAELMLTDFPAAVYQGVTGIPGQMADRGREIRQGGDVLSVYIGGSFEFAGGVGSAVKIPENLVNAGAFTVRYSGLAGQNEKYRANLEAEAIALGAQNLDMVYNSFIKGRELEFLGGALGSGGAFAPLRVGSRAGARITNVAGSILGPVQGAHNQFDSFTGFSSGFNSSNGFSNFIFSNDSSSLSVGIK